MYMRFVVKHVRDLDCLQYNYMNFALAFGHCFEEILILLHSWISPHLLVIHLSSRPVMKSGILRVAIFLPLRELYAFKVYGLYPAATIWFL